MPERPPFATRKIPHQNQPGTEQLREPVIPVQVLRQITHQAEVDTPADADNKKIFTGCFAMRFAAVEGEKIIQDIIDYRSQHITDSRSRLGAEQMQIIVSGPQRQVLYQSARQTHRCKAQKLIDKGSVEMMAH